MLKKHSSLETVSTNEIINEIILFIIIPTHVLRSSSRRHFIISVPSRGGAYCHGSERAGTRHQKQSGTIGSQCWRIRHSIHWRNVWRHQQCYFLSIESDIQNSKGKLLRAETMKPFISYVSFIHAYNYYYLQLIRILLLGTSVLSARKKSIVFLVSNVNQLKKVVSHSIFSTNLYFRGISFECLSCIPPYSSTVQLNWKIDYTSIFIIFWNYKHMSEL